MTDMATVLPLLTLVVTEIRLSSFLETATTTRQSSLTMLIVITDTTRLSLSTISATTLTESW
jgi:hypothetical protein